MIGTKLYIRGMQAKLFRMETKQELQQLLQRLQMKWDGGNLSSPSEIVRLDKQMKEHLKDSGLKHNTQ